MFLAVLPEELTNIGFSQQLIKLQLLLLAQNYRPKLSEEEKKKKGTNRARMLQSPPFLPVIVTGGWVYESARSGVSASTDSRAVWTLFNQSSSRSRRALICGMPRILGCTHETWTVPSTWLIMPSIRWTCVKCSSDESQIAYPWDEHEQGCYNWFHQLLVRGKKKEPAYIR